MSDLQQSNSPEQNMAQAQQGPIPCVWCGGLNTHYGWCDWEQLKSLHDKIDKLTIEIERLRELRLTVNEVLKLCRDYP